MGAGAAGRRRRSAGGGARARVRGAAEKWKTSGGGLPGAPAVLAIIVLGVAGIWGSTQFSYVAIYYTTAGNVVILQAAPPVMVALGARFYLGERLATRQWLGVVVSVFGVLLVITSGRLGALRLEELRAGDFIALGSLIGWSIYTVYGKRVLAILSPALATTGAYVAGTLLILPTALLTAPLFPAPRPGSLTAWGGGPVPGGRPPPRRRGGGQTRAPPPTTIFFSLFSFL